VNSATYEVNAPRMTAEIIDGEVMIVDFQDGYYYNLLGSSALAWALIAAGHTIPHVRETLEQHCTQADLHASLEAFITELRANNLIRPSSSNAVQAIELSAFPAVYTGLSVQRYADMQELLLLDPIHDVDASGWPHVRG
jgi:hypothetical protein